MTQPDPNPQRPLAATPALERLLRRLRARLTRQVWLFGAGTLLGLVSVWLAFAFFSDWALRVPRGVRLFHLLVLFALPLLVAWRYLVVPLRRRPDRAGLAILIERCHRGLHELLVSAVQLQERATEADPALVQRVLAEAEERAGALGLEGVLEERPPAWRFTLGASAALCLAVGALLSPVHTRIFLLRLLGGSTAWPQRTNLELTIPLVADKAQVLAAPGRLDVRVARGTDVPVVVRASGKLPATVTLHFVGSQDLVLSPSSDGVFRALLRARQEDLEFYATGGDDSDGDPRVFLEVLEPPDVAGLAVHIQPPAYTGLPARVEFDRDVEVLAGSELEVTVLPSPPDARGRARILPADQILELTPAPFPLRPPEDGAEPAAPETAQQQGLAFRITAEESLRFRFELEDESGLSNPDPGLFAVNVVQDRRPEVEVLAPGRAEVDTVPGGTLALHAVASDDFGLASMGWSVFSASEGEESARLTELAFRPIDNWDADGRAGALAFGAGQRIEVGSLAGAERAVAEGEQYVLQVIARDIRPGGGEEGLGRSPQVRVRVVSTEEFLRRVQDRLSRLRLRVSELEELQRQKQRLTQELVLSLESDAPELASAAGELNAVLSGQRRVGGDAEALVRELAAITESVLYARIDDKSVAALEQMDAALSANMDRRFQYEVWRNLSIGWRRTAPAGPGLASQLMGLLDLGLAIGLDDCRPAAAALERAGQHVDLTQVHTALLEATEHQARALTHIEDLLGRLAEWDNFQSILSLTRDILSRQKALMERTKNQVREK